MAPMAPPATSLDFADPIFPNVIPTPVLYLLQTFS